MYIFTKLHFSVHKYGGKTKFGAKNEEWTKAVNTTMWYFLRLAGKLNNNWMNELY